MCMCTHYCVHLWAGPHLSHPHLACTMCSLLKRHLADRMSGTSCSRFLIIGSDLVCELTTFCTRSTGSSSRSHSFKASCLLCRSCELLCVKPQNFCLESAMPSHFPVKVRQTGSDECHSCFGAIQTPLTEHPILCDIQ